MKTDKIRIPLLKRQIEYVKTELKEESRGSQNAGFAILLKGNVDVSRLEQALDVLIKENDALRTHLELNEDSKIYHVVEEETEGWIRHDYRNMKEEEAEKKAFAAIQEENVRAMDLFAEAMFIFHMYLISDKKVILYVKASHVITDGPSFRAIYSQLADLYSGKDNNTSDSWREMVEREIEFIKSEKGIEETLDWKVEVEKFPEDVAIDEIISVGKKELNQSGAGSFSMEKLKEIATAAGTSVFNTIMVMYSYGLGKIFGKDSMAINYTMADRFTKQTRYAIGLTTHKVPCCIKGIGTNSIFNILKESKEQSIKAFECFKTSDQVEPYTFTLSYLTNTVKVSSWSGLDAEIINIEGNNQSGDYSFVMMCSETEDKVVLNPVADSRIYKQSFISALYAYMKEAMEELYTEITSVKKVHFPDIRKKNSISNLGHSFILKGNIDRDRLKRAVEKLYERFDILKCVFVETENGEFDLVYDKDISRQLDFTEVLGETPEERKNNAIKDTQERMKEVLYLSKDSCGRFNAYIISEDEVMISIVISHFLVDGESLGVLMETFIKLYEDPERNDLPKIKQALDFKIDYHRFLMTEDFKKMAGYWQEKVRTYKAPEIPKLPSDKEIQESVNLSFEKEKIERISKEAKASNFYVLLGLYHLALSEVTGQNDVGISYSHSGRLREDELKMVGSLVKMIFTRSFFRKEDSWKKIIKEMMNQDDDIKNLRGAMANRNLQFTFSYNTENNFTDIKTKDDICILENKDYEEVMSGFKNMCICIGKETKDHIHLYICGDPEQYTMGFREKLCALMSSYVDKILENPNAQLSEIAGKEAFIVKTEEYVGNKVKLPLTRTMSYYLKKEYPDNPGSFNLGNGLYLKNVKDIDRLKRAITKIYDRYDAFRMVFHPEGDTGYLTVEDTQYPEVEVLEAVGETEEQRYEYAVRESRNKVKIPILLSSKGMNRFWIYKISEDSVVVAYSSNHLINDGGSIALMEYCLEKYYEDPDRTDLPDPGKFSDFLLERQALFESEKGKQEIEYWKKRMDGYEDPVIIKPEAGKETRPSMMYGMTKLDLEDVKKVASECKASNFNIIYLLWQLSLAETMKQNDIAMRYAFSGRDSEDLSNMFGLIAHGITVRSDFKTEDKWYDLVQNFKTTCDEDMKRVSTSDYIGVREFVMSYVVNTGMAERKHFADADVSEAFSLTSTYFTGRYLAAMVVEDSEHITVYPYCSNDEYGTEMVMQLGKCLKHNLQKIMEDPYMKLKDICMTKDFLKVSEKVKIEMDLFTQEENRECTNTDDDLVLFISEKIKDALELEELPNPDENFFDIGGSSFKAFYIINNLLGDKKDMLKFSDFYNSESIRELAEVMAERV